LAFVGSPALKHRKPIHSGQAQVENYSAIIFRVAAKPGLLAVANGLDHVAGSFQRVCHVGRDSGIVLDQKHAHLFFLDVFDIAATRVDVHLKHAADMVDHSELVVPAALFALDFDTRDVAGYYAPNLLQDL
jgi:hypothetical protein